MRPDRNIQFLKDALWHKHRRRIQNSIRTDVMLNILILVFKVPNRKAPANISDKLFPHEPPLFRKLIHSLKAIRPLLFETLGCGISYLMFSSLNYIHRHICYCTDFRSTGFSSVVQSLAWAACLGVLEQAFKLR